jgi:hypothetical protein
MTKAEVVDLVGFYNFVLYNLFIGNHLAPVTLFKLAYHSLGHPA